MSAALAVKKELLDEPLEQEQSPLGGLHQSGIIFGMPEVRIISST